MVLVLEPCSDTICNIPAKQYIKKILINQKKQKQGVCFDCQDILLIMQITISQAEIYEKLNQIYLLESREKHTLGESTPPNHRRQQINCLLCSTPELDHQPCTRTASNFLAALNPRVRNKFSRWTYKIEKCSTHTLSNHFPNAQHSVLCYSSALI